MIDSCGTVHRDDSKVWLFMDSKVCGQLPGWPVEGAASSEHRHSGSPPQTPSPEMSKVLCDDKCLISWLI